MKTIACAAILALISIATPSLTSAQTSGPSASGSYRVTFEDDLAKTLEFNAATDERGTTTGQMTFTDEAGVGELDGDLVGDGRGDPPPPFYMTADLDTLTIENNRALMAGTIRDSSDRRYIGRWVQLVVEDGREGPDNLSWCFCEPEASGWTPVDAEDPRDDGAWWHWWATDAEFRDDVGVPSTNIIPGNRRACLAFPLSSYAFLDARGEGQIQVNP
jgi:hypothetical protein